MRFYKLDRNFSRRNDTVFLQQNERPSDDADFCEVCNGTVSSLKWLPPYQAKLMAKGKTFSDFAFGPGDSLLVSQKFRAVYFEEGLTGLEDFSLVKIVKVRARKKLGEPPAYFRAWPIRGETALDMAACEFEYSHPPICPRCMSGIADRWKRIVIDMATWTGEDVFIPRGLNAIMVTQRFKDVCERHGITNVFLTPAEEAGHDFYPWKKQAELERPDEPKE